jgi:hypothetical protein
VNKAGDALMRRQAEGIEHIAVVGVPFRDLLCPVALKQTFPASDAVESRSISSVNHTTEWHEFSIPALCSLAAGRLPEDCTKTLTGIHQRSSTNLLRRCEANQLFR